MLRTALDADEPRPLPGGPQELGLGAAQALDAAIDPDMLLPDAAPLDAAIEGDGPLPPEVVNNDNLPFAGSSLAGVAMTAHAYRRRHR